MLRPPQFFTLLAAILMPGSSILVHRADIERLLHAESGAMRIPFFLAASLGRYS
jgi:hypothetical protein